MYSTALAAMAMELESSGAETRGEVALLRQAVEAAEVAVVGIGHAQPGDKTVVDALHPVVEAFR